MLDCQLGGGNLDHVFSELNDDDGTPAEVQELAKRSGEDLIVDLAAIGVHVTDRLVMVPVEEDMSSARAVMQGAVGDIAFSDRVLRPQILDDGDVLADIEDATAAAEYDAIRKRLLNGDDDA